MLDIENSQTEGEPLPVSTIACTPQYDPILFWLKLSLTVLPSLGKFKVHSLILIPYSLIKKK